MKLTRRGRRVRFWSYFILFSIMFMIGVLSGPYYIAGP